MFSTELLLVWPVGHMDSHIADWVAKLSQGKEMVTFHLECDALTCRAIRNTLYCVWQSDRGMGRDFWRTCKRGKVILKQCRCLNVFFIASELKPASITSRKFPFWFGT